MIHIDRVLCRSILKATQNYSDLLYVSAGSSDLVVTDDSVVDGGVSRPIPLEPSEVFPSVRRLADMNIVKIRNTGMPDRIYFSITPELLHKKAFWFDAFSHKYIGGFVSGVVTTVAAELLILWLTGLL